MAQPNNKQLFGNLVNCLSQAVGLSCRDLSNMAAEVVALALAATVAATAAAEAAAAVIATAVAASVTAMALCEPFMCGGRHTGSISSAQVMRECISSVDRRRGAVFDRCRGHAGGGSPGPAISSGGGWGGGPGGSGGGVARALPADACKTVIGTTWSFCSDGNAAVVARRLRAAAGCLALAAAREVVLWAVVS